ncbi:Hypothetical predicted protein [Octopus vulgaris]|uniref:Uncharacterized protein n=1 Tax=Octopus vulgaris TaxID=6645 RepID=A0AA36AJM7_OCTVU|nr:Hypothetical predicted protein [Octopus vulgaris]
MDAVSPTILLTTTTRHSSILKEYPDVAQPVFHNQPIKHDVTHHIKTSGPPVAARPRRLTPDRLKAVKREFLHLLDLGIIRPSSSNWSSPIHCVPPKPSTDWWVCGDYRSLNKSTISDVYPAWNSHLFQDRPCGSIQPNPSGTCGHLEDSSYYTLRNV